jgi:hypothetical protein
MTIYNPDPQAIRDDINDIANGGKNRFLTDFYGSTLDGSDVAEYLRMCCFEVESFRDTGGCGLTTLANGVKVSTNGYAYK